MCLKLATNARDATIKSREDGVHPDQLVSISTNVRKCIKDVVAVRCKESGISQESYVRRLILHDLGTKYKVPHYSIEEKTMQSIKLQLHSGKNK